MSPESECLNCHEKFFSPDEKGLEARELEHHKQSLRPLSAGGQRVDGSMHGCKGFRRMDGQGKFKEVVIYCHGQLFRDYLSR